MRVAVRYEEEMIINYKPSETRESVEGTGQEKRDIPSLDFRVVVPLDDLRG